jgi:hypothetical protein
MQSNRAQTNMHSSNPVDQEHLSEGRRPRYGKISFLIRV